MKRFFRMMWLRKSVSNHVDWLMYSLSREHYLPAKIINYAGLSVLVYALSYLALVVVIGLLEAPENANEPKVFFAYVPAIMAASFFLWGRLLIWSYAAKISKKLFFVSDENRVPRCDKKRVEEWFPNHDQAVADLIKSAQEKRNFKTLHALKRLGLYNATRI